MSLFKTYTSRVVGSDAIIKNMMANPTDRYSIDFMDDERFPRLAERLGEEIRNNKWKLPENEQQICERCVSLVHSDEFLGPYNNMVRSNQEKIDDLNIQINSMSAENEDVANALKKDRDRIRQSMDAKRHEGVVKSETILFGEAVCDTEALAVSYALGMNDIANDYVSSREVTYLDGTPVVTGHAYVQSRLTGNIIEATSPTSPYKWNKNGGILEKNEVAVVVDKSGQLEHYGAGSISLPTFKDNKAKDSALEQNVKKAREDFLDHNSLDNVINGLSVEGSQFLTKKAIKNSDTGSGLFNFNGDKSNSKLSPSEIISFLEKQGVELSEQDKEDLKEITKNGVEIKAAFNQAHRIIANLDVNQNRKIDGNELKNYDYSMKMIFIEATDLTCGNVPKASVINEPEIKSR